MGWVGMGWVSLQLHSDCPPILLIPPANAFIVNFDNQQDAATHTPAKMPLLLKHLHTGEKKMGYDRKCITYIRILYI